MPIVDEDQARINYDHSLFKKIALVDFTVSADLFMHFTNTLKYSRQRWIGIHNGLCYALAHDYEYP